LVAEIDDGGNGMTRYHILGLCALVLFVAITPPQTFFVKRLPTVHLQHSLIIPDIKLTPINQLPNDGETQKFIVTYMRHGDQFDPRLNGGKQ
jgi:hypothetical protein